MWKARKNRQQSLMVLLMILIGLLLSLHKGPTVLCLKNVQVLSIPSGKVSIFYFFNFYFYLVHVPQRPVYIKDLFSGAWCYWDTVDLLRGWALQEVRSLVHALEGPMGTQEPSSLLVSCYYEETASLHEIFALWCLALCKHNSNEASWPRT